MNRISNQSDRDAVRDATSLVDLIGEHVSLKRRGREFVGLCPFHDDHNPSFSVVTHKGSEFYICNSCGESGDAFTFVMKYHRMDFPGALRFLADRAGVTLTPWKPGKDGAAPSDDRDRHALLMKATDFAARFYRKHKDDLPSEHAASQALAGRGFTPEIIEAFGIGLAPDGWDTLTNVIHQRQLPMDAFVDSGLVKRREQGDGCYDAFRNRIIFPIADELGRPIAFGARIIDPDDSPKYLNSPETALFEKSKTLFGLHLAKRAIIDAGLAIVTEGYTDVIACHQAGVQNVVATLGTALTPAHARILQRLCQTVVLVFDGDEAGQRAADRAVEVFFTSKVDVRICVLPGDKDPDELLRESDGVETFHSWIDRAVDAIEFKLSRFRSRLDQSQGLSGRQTVIETFLTELGGLGFGRLQGVRKSLVINELASMTGLPVASIERTLRDATRQSDRMAEMRQSHDEMAVTDEMLIPEFIPQSPESESSTRRRKLEEEILAMLLAEPALRRAPLSVPRGEGSTPDHTTVLELLGSDRFMNLDLALLAEVLLQQDRADDSLTVQALLSELTHDQVRSVVPVLFRRGAAMLEVTDPSAEDRLLEACMAMRGIDERTEYERNLAAYRNGSDGGDSSLDSLQQLIRSRGEQQYVTGALPRIRSKPV